MRYFSFLAVIMLISASSQAQYSDAGTTIFPLLNINYDARSVAMAGASVAIPNANSGVFSNPAAIADIKHMQAFLGYRQILDGVWGGPVALSRSFGRFGVYSINLAAITSGDIEVIDEKNGEPVYTDKIAGSNYIAGGLSWGYHVMENLSVGATVKGIYNNIKDGTTRWSAAGAAVDAGVLYQMLMGRFTAAAAVRNLGFLVWSYDEDESNDLPLTVEAGISFVPRYIKNVRIAFDINKRRGDYLNFEPGLEVGIYKNYLLARLGYAFSTADIQQAFKSFSGEQDQNYIKSNWNILCLGVGLNTNVQNANLQIDFALQFHSSSLPPSVMASAIVDF